MFYCGPFEVALHRNLTIKTQKPWYIGMMCHGSISLSKQCFRLPS